LISKVLNVGTNEAFRRWNWQLIAQTLDTAYSSTDFFEYLVNSKFLRRFLDFYRPSGKWFPTLALSEVGGNVVNARIQTFVEPCAF
jgi:hypothetical protein